MGSGEKQTQLKHLHNCGGQTEKQTLLKHQLKHLHNCGGQTEKQTLLKHQLKHRSNRKADTAEASAEASSQLWRSKRLEHFVCKLCRVEEKEILQNLLWLDKLLQQLRQLKQANM